MRNNFLKVSSRLELNYNVQIGNVIIIIFSTVPYGIPLSITSLTIPSESTTN